MVVRRGQRVAAKAGCKIGVGDLLDLPGRDEPLLSQSLRMLSGRDVLRASLPRTLETAFEGNVQPDRSIAIRIEPTASLILSSPPPAPLRD